MNERNIEDIKQAIVRQKIKLHSDAQINYFYVPQTRQTIAIITEIPSSGYIDLKSIHTHVGIARKRKGDKYNQTTGEIIALLNAQKL